MLVFTRRIGEQIQIGDDIVLTVVRVRGRDVQVGISAPPGVAVHRAEIYRRINAAEDSPIEARKAESA